MAKEKKPPLDNEQELKNLIGDAVRVDFKDMLKVAYAEHETAFITMLKSDIEQAKKMLNEASAEMQQAKIKAEKARNLLTICDIKKATLHELMRHRANSFEYSYMIDNDGIVIDPNVLLPQKS